MLTKRVSRTALGTATGRALESYRPEGDRLFEDRFAMGFLPPMHRAIVRLLQIPVIGPALLAARERQIPGIMGNLLCRTRFIDDTLLEALAMGAEQVVILGAGLDSRAYRITGIDRSRVFELDHTATQAWKRGRVERLPDEFRSHVTFVPIDFEREELGEATARAGFQAGAKTFWIWEGVTQYIGAEAVDSTIGFIERGTVPGGRVVFTYIDGGLIDGSVQLQGMEEFLRGLERQGEPWVFGIKPGELCEYLAARSLKLVEDVGAADYRTRYLEPVGRKMDVFAGERVAVAEIARVG